MNNKRMRELAGVEGNKLEEWTQPDLTEARGPAAFRHRAFDHAQRFSEYLGDILQAKRAGDVASMRNLLRRWSKQKARLRSIEQSIPDLLASLESV